MRVEQQPEMLATMQTGAITSLQLSFYRRNARRVQLELIYEQNVFESIGSTSILFSR